MTSPAASSIEFRIIIAANELRAEWGTSGDADRTAKVKDWAIDDLSLRTALLFEKWLNLWTRIEEVRGAKIIHKPETVRLIGQHLWNLILTDRDGKPNAVGTALQEQVTLATKGPLHVFIDFDDTANQDLRVLPWEFLYDPNGKEFLAARENVVFTRWVDLPNGRKEIEASRSVLRVLFLNLTPGKVEQRVGEEIQELRDTLNAELRGKVKVARVVRGLDAKEKDETGQPTSSIALALREGNLRCQVVHVFGVCKGAPGAPQIWLPNAKDYGDPAPLVNALTSRVKPPALVVLHLAEWNEGDAEDNFERLAPLLIKKGVPAVLAMQYPLPTTANRERLVDLYRQLAGKDLLGTVVQESRRSALGQDETIQLVGTPVLYLQRDGLLLNTTQLMPEKNPVVATTGSGVGTALSRPLITQASIRLALLTELDIGWYDPARADYYRGFIQQIDLTDTVEGAREALKDFARRNPADMDREINAGLRKRLDLLEGGGDAGHPAYEQPKPSGPGGFVSR